VTDAIAKVRELAAQLCQDAQNETPGG
jgi:hypothetical protein